MSLKRSEMEEIIRGGGSVLVTLGNGKKKLVATLENLPSPLELATTEEEKVAAKADIRKQILDLEKQAGDDGGEVRSRMLGAGTADNIAPEEITVESLSKEKRGTLDQMAKDLNLNPEDYANIPEIAQAIFEAQSAKE